MNSELPASTAPRRRKFLLTKTVNPKWYRRYAHVLPTSEIVFQQPAKEIREEAEMIKAATTPPPKQDTTELLAKRLAEERDNRVKTVLSIMEGGSKNIMAKIKKLKPMTNALKAAVVEKKEKKKSFVLEVPPDWFLPKNSKWRVIKSNENVKRKLERMKMQMRQDDIIRRWQKAIRTVRAVIRFGLIMADIARTTDEVFKEFNQMADLQKKKNEEEGGLFFDKTKYKSENSKMSLHNSTILTLRNLEILRTEEETRQAAFNLRVVKTFAEFPEFFQYIMTRIGWYLEVPSDKVIIREGQPPMNFYFLLSGKAVAVALNGSPVQGEPGKFDIVRILDKDSLFGEDGMVYGHDYRRYSVTALETCRLLSVAFDDFNRMVAQPPSPGENAEHISLLSQFEFMRYFPMAKLVEDMGSGNILLFYFAPGKIISRKTKESPFIYIIKKGSAKVYAQMNSFERKVRNMSVCVAKPQSFDRVSIVLEESDSGNIQSEVSLPRINAGGIKRYTDRRRIGSVKSESMTSSGRYRNSVFHKMDEDLAAFAPETPGGHTDIKGKKITQSIAQAANDKLMRVNSSFFDLDIDIHDPIAMARNPSAKKLTEHGYDLEKMGSNRTLALSQSVDESCDLALQHQKLSTYNKPRRTIIDHLCNDEEHANSVRQNLIKQKKQYYNIPSQEDVVSDSLTLNRYTDSEHSSLRLQEAASKEKFLVRTKKPEIKWIFLKEIRENDYLGLEDIDFGDEKTGCNVSIVSEGCECILLSKKFFMAHASPRMLAHLRANCDVFPGQADLHRELRRQQYWTNFKNKTFANLAEKKLHDAKNK